MKNMYEDVMNIQILWFLICFVHIIDKQTCLVGIVHNSHENEILLASTVLQVLETVSCARNHGCESQPLVATRNHSRICRDLPVASRNQRVSIRLRVVTKA